MTDDGALKQITLFSQKGGSDKVYQLQVSEVEGGYNLVYANGRRGQSLKPKVKNPQPLDREIALKEFEKVVKSKKNGSSKYQESTDNGATLLPNADDGKACGFSPQLLNSIEEADALALCRNDEWVAQEKHDGERRLIKVSPDGVQGINKKGDYCGLISEIADGINKDTSMVVDSEDLKDHCAAFDLLECDGVDLRSLSFAERYKRLTVIAADHPAMVLSPLSVTTEEKLKLLQSLKDSNAEGIVFKRKSAPYREGRPNSKGDQLKFKFYTEACVIVTRINDRRSVQMSVLDENLVRVNVGNVTIPQNASIPQIGDVIEVRYLYAYKDGSLYQPTLEKPRNDVDAEECLQSQLKYRRQ